MAGDTLQLQYAWFAVGAVYMLDAIWAHAIGLMLSGYAPFLMVMIMLIGVTGILRWRRRNPTLAVATEVAALWLVLGNSGAILSYLSATTPIALQDDLLASADRALGFRWPVLFQWVGQHPVVGGLLSTCYHSLTLEMLVLTVCLACSRHEQRIRELWTVYVSILLTCILSAVVPAAGAFAYYGLPDRADWLCDLKVLRGGSNLHFTLTAMVGIVTFPSFHTVLAMLVIYIVRGTGVVGHLFMAWNVIMLISIPPFGGHYLADMIGGGTVLAVSIGMFRCAAGANRCRQILAHQNVAV